MKFRIRTRLALTDLGLAWIFQRIPRYVIFFLISGIARRDFVSPRACIQGAHLRCTRQSVACLRHVFLNQLPSRACWPQPHVPVSRPGLPTFAIEAVASQMGSYVGTYFSTGHDCRQTRRHAGPNDCVLQVQIANWVEYKRYGAR
jgi:hypothetical protein